MRWADKLAKLMEERGWNRADLARAAGVTKPTVAGWLDDDVRPYGLSVVRLKAATGVSLDALLDDAAELPGPPSRAEKALALLIEMYGIDAVMDNLTEMQRRHDPTEPALSDGRAVPASDAPATRPRKRA